mgnify:CR=1 FL=1
MEQVAKASEAILERVKVLAPKLRWVWISSANMRLEGAGPAEGVIWIREKEDGDWRVLEQGTGGRKWHFKSEDPSHWIRERWDSGFKWKVLRSK